MECKLIYRIILIYFFVTKTLSPKKFPQLFGFLIFGDPFQKKLIKKLHFSFSQNQNTFPKPRFLKFCRKVAVFFYIIKPYNYRKAEIYKDIYDQNLVEYDREKSRFALLTGLRPVFRWADRYKKIPAIFWIFDFRRSLPKKLVKKLHFSFLQKQNTFPKPRFLKFCRKVAEKLREFTQNHILMRFVNIRYRIEFLIFAII